MAETTTEYAIRRDIDLDFDAAVDKVTAALAEEGFGILTQIDMQAKMKEKLDRDMDRYLILGACNPPLAWDAVHAEYDLGVLLPCNVCVYERDGQVTISAMEPKAALSLIDNDVVARVAEEASVRLRRAVGQV